MHSPGHPLPIVEVAEGLGIPRRHLAFYGDDKAKVRLAARQDGGSKPGKLILVSAITPTDAGEGKTTTSIGLAQGLAKVGQKVCLALREPSLGPTFGRKGGATGGGKASVTPMEDINLHFTGDFHAISTANNLLAAMLDNHLHHGNQLGLDPRRVTWRRVMDLNDRALRQILIGLGGPLQGVPRETGFDITPASEVMAALCLAEDAEDLGKRLGRMLVGLTYDRQPVTAAELKAVGAMRVLLKDAIHPNLVQTLEGVPAFIHGGPFANIAHGCNSVAATKMAMAYADWTVTEAGFGADLGAEKFFDIKCAGAGLKPAVTVLVATIRALKRHGGVKKKELGETNAAAVEAGLDNLRKHVENIQLFGEPPVVTLNRFAGDEEEEVAVVRAACRELKVPFAVCDGFAEGGPGAVELAHAVLEHAQLKEESTFHPLYDWSDSIPDKLETVAKKVYGAGKVSWTAEARKDLKMISNLGYEGLPLCVAKTPASLSDDPKLINRPQGFTVTVRGLILSAGAGFVVPLMGDIMRMPGLAKKPAAFGIDLVDGEVRGVS
ncbi:MAG: formate--tetrahydrofolate ligase [Acidobacteriota bacterium]|nr:formate--tetrahydrofolate ligase [Acidobacteriota bacterium]